MNSCPSSSSSLLIDLIILFWIFYIFMLKQKPHQAWNGNHPIFSLFNLISSFSSLLLFNFILQLILLVYFFLSYFLLLFCQLLTIDIDFILFTKNFWFLSFRPLIRSFNQTRQSPHLTYRPYISWLHCAIIFSLPLHPARLFLTIAILFFFFFLINLFSHSFTHFIFFLYILTILFIFIFFFLFLVRTNCSTVLKENNRFWPPTSLFFPFSLKTTLLPYVKWDTVGANSFKAVVIFKFFGWGTSALLYLDFFFFFPFLFDFIWFDLFLFSFNLPPILLYRDTWFFSFLNFSFFKN